MATRTLNLTHDEQGLLVGVAVGLANGDQSGGGKFGLRRAEVAVQVTGTLGAGGSAQLEGSNDGTNWFLQGTAMTALGLQTVVTAAKWLRVNVTAGDGTTSLTAIIVAHPGRG